jgi:hypothetical protein
MGGEEMWKNVQQTDGIDFRLMLNTCAHLIDSFVCQLNVPSVVILELSSSNFR